MRCRRYRLLKLRGSINRCGRVGGTKHLSACQVAQTNKLELLKWAREEKQCEWNSGTIHVAAKQGNLEMIKYCVANKCPINECMCANAALNGQLECLKYLREEGKAPFGLGYCPLGRLEMVISTYSNILSSVSLMNITNLRVIMQPSTATWTV